LVRRQAATGASKPRDGAERAEFSSRRGGNSTNKNDPPVHPRRAVFLSTARVAPSRAFGLESASLDSFFRLVDDLRDRRAACSAAAVLVSHSPKALAERPKNMRLADTHRGPAPRGNSVAKVRRCEVRAMP
jgi:hypothetical protein